MAEAYNFLNGSQTDINRRLLRRIEALEAATGAEGTDINALESDVATLQTDVGKTDSSANSLKKRCKDIETTIGDESTEGSILARIKALEDAT